MKYEWIIEEPEGPALVYERLAQIPPKRLLPAIYGGSARLALRRVTEGSVMVAYFNAEYDLPTTFLPRAIRTPVPQCYHVEFEQLLKNMGLN